MAYPSDSQFIPFMLGGSPFGDVPNDESPGSVDLVGNSTFPSGSGYVYRIPLSGPFRAWYRSSRSSRFTEPNNLYHPPFSNGYNTRNGSIRFNRLTSCWSDRICTNGKSTKQNWSCSWHLLGCSQCNGEWRSERDSNARCRRNRDARSGSGSSSHERIFSSHNMSDYFVYPILTIWRITPLKNMKMADNSFFDIIAVEIQLFCFG